VTAASSIIGSSQFAIGHARSSKSVTLFTSRSVAAFNSRCLSSSGQPNASWPSSEYSDSLWTEIKRLQDKLTEENSDKSTSPVDMPYDNGGFTFGQALFKCFFFIYVTEDKLNLCYKELSLKGV
jgi:hypothetical protein